jgi:transcriptional regulator with XRE-family HTH domain
MSDDLATRLRTKRHQEGSSLRMLGQQLGMAFSTLARIERGAGQPDPHTRLRLEAWLDPSLPRPPCPCAWCVGRPLDGLTARVATLESQVAALESRLRACVRLVQALEA